MQTWTEYFTAFFDQSEAARGVVLNASGCREGWIQGEFFRFGQGRRLRVNEYPLGGNKKADLFCDVSPRMIAEIKILGADYFGKMRHYLDSDVARLQAVPDETLERYMILVIPHSNVQSRLGEHLHSVSYSERCSEKNYRWFKTRIWQLTPTAK